MAATWPPRQVDQPSLRRVATDGAQGAALRAHVLLPDLLVRTLTPLPRRLPPHHAAPSVLVLPLLVLEGQEVVTAECQCKEREGSLGGHEKDITAEGRRRGGRRLLRSKEHPCGERSVKGLGWTDQGE